MPRRKKVSTPGWTPNQIVAHNIAKARLLRGWTQEEAAVACEPHLGARLSNASWSALERSVDGTRIRQVSADELIGFARAFDLPVGFFLTPPSAWDGRVVTTPDTGDAGLEPVELFDVVIGTPDNLAAWEQYLLTWPSPEQRIRVSPDGEVDDLGRAQDDVHPRLAALTTLRARILLREQFGDLNSARAVLTGLAKLIDNLDDPGEPDDAPEVTRRHEPTNAKTRSAKRT